MSNSYIVSGCRTPIGKYLGALAGVRSVELGGHAIAAALIRSGIDALSIDQVILGQVIQAGVGQSPARQACTLAKLPSSVGAITVNKVCGSGLVAVMMADMGIRAGEYRRVIAGGMESMSQAPHLLRQGRSGWKYGEQSLFDAVDIDGLRCAHLDLAMGCIAEWVSKNEKITRAQQDAWSVRSHQRANASVTSGHFDSEIVPVPTMEGRNSIVRNRDETPRSDCNVEGLAKLKSAFVSKLVRVGDEDYVGTVTAGNASTLSDGAAALVVVDEATYAAHQSPWAFRIIGHSCFASDHQDIFTAPVGAVKKVLEKANMALDQVDLFEINVAFAAQTLACIDLLGIDPEKVNVNGGAIALGHPLGCSGARVLVTLIHNLIASHRQYGVATLCLGGGEAVAMLIERVR